MRLGDDLIEALRNKMEREGLTRADVAHRLNTTGQTVGQWLSGKRKTCYDTTGERLKHWLGITVSSCQESCRSIPTTPVYGLAQADSIFQHYGDVVPESEDVLDSVTVPKSLRGYTNVAAFEVSGDSMEPSLPDGVYAFIAPDEPLHDGDIALVKYEDQIVCKRIIRVGSVVLYSDNPDYPPITLLRDDIQWAYKVVGKLQIEKFNDGEH